MCVQSNFKPSLYKSISVAAAYLTYLLIYWFANSKYKIVKNIQIQSRDVTFFVVVELPSPTCVNLSTKQVFVSIIEAKAETRVKEFFQPRQDDDDATTFPGMDNASNNLPC